MSDYERARRHRVILMAAAVLLWSAAPAHAASAPTQRIEAGLPWVVERSLALRGLVIEAGAAVMAPPGHSVSMTVNGVETGLRPGEYRGRILLTVTEATPVRFDETLTHEFRQALYLDTAGIATEKSVLAAAGPFAYAGGVLNGARITSVGEDFNGIRAAGGHHTVAGAVIDLSGNGGDDFAGFGAAVMSAGPDTTLVVDRTRITTRGAIRTAAVADKGSHLVVKNSELTAYGGSLPAGYVPNSALGRMKNVPWMLGLVGNNRATNLLGNDTQATYINSSITSEEWGVLSVDLNQNARLTAINSRLRISGRSGYGTYAIGNSLNSFYGSEIDVPDYGAIVVGGKVAFAASTPENVARLNSELSLGLTHAELAALPRRATIVKSRRFGVMIWGTADVQVVDDTRIETGQATFLVKSAPATINVDGSGGARLIPRNGILLQLMETDNPGVVTVNGQRLTIGVYHEPDAPAVRAPEFDVTATHTTDVVAHFAGMALKGDFYNAARGGRDGAAAGGLGLTAGTGPTGGPAAPSIGAPPRPSGRNLVLQLDHSSLEGRATASSARHEVRTITALEYARLGEITNTPEPAINNGVILALDHSTWTVTAASHLTSLTIDAASSVRAPGDDAVSMTVDGVPTPIRPGSYQGQIVVAPSR